MIDVNDIRTPEDAAEFLAAHHGMISCAVQEYTMSDENTTPIVVAGCEISKFRKILAILIPGYKRRLAANYSLTFRSITPKEIKTSVTILL